MYIQPERGETNRVDYGNYVARPCSTRSPALLPPCTTIIHFLYIKHTTGRDATLVHLARLCVLHLVIFRTELEINQAKVGGRIRKIEFEFRELWEIITTRILLAKDIYSINLYIEGGYILQCVYVPLYYFGLSIEIRGCIGYGLE